MSDTNDVNVKLGDISSLTKDYLEKLKLYVRLNGLSEINKDDDDI